jgi:hypothetical protein
MRALCGAIITAAALLGLGLTAIGYGNRYHATAQWDKETKAWVQTNPEHLDQLDKSLLFCIAYLACAGVIGFGIAFFGLAYHHHRRYHEHLREHGRWQAEQGRTTTGPPT